MAQKHAEGLTTMVWWITKKSIIFRRETLYPPHRAQSDDRIHYNIITFHVLYVRGVSHRKSI